VFLAGFLVTNLLSSRPGRTSSSLEARLFRRGGKLLILFTVLNLGAAWLEKGRDPGHGSPIEVMVAAYLTGQGASFSVLVPISYTLMLAALFEKTRGLSRFRFPAPIVLAFALVSALVLAGLRVSALELVGAGLLGLALGHVLAQRHGLILRLWPWLVLAYVLHLGALTLWGVPYVLQLVSVCVNLFLIYLLGDRLPSAGGATQLMHLLGRYTLLGYVGQIAVLQILAVGFRRVDLGRAQAPIALAAAVVLTIAAIGVADLLRRRSRLADSLYKLVFA
jgi:hypothetical protein